MTHHHLKVDKETTIELTFGLPSLQMIQDKVVQYPEILQGRTFSSTGYSYILYFSYKNNCMVKETKPNYTFAYFLELLEKSTDDSDLLLEIQNAVNAWSESKHIKDMNDKSKKKQKETKTT